MTRPVPAVWFGPWYQLLAPHQLPKGQACQGRNWFCHMLLSWFLPFRQPDLVTFSAANKNSLKLLTNEIQHTQLTHQTLAGWKSLSLLWRRYCCFLRPTDHLNVTWQPPARCRQFHQGWTWHSRPCRRLNRISRSPCQKSSVWIQEEHQN